jgi:hypothetical protein
MPPASTYDTENGVPVRSSHADRLGDGSLTVMTGWLLGSGGFGSATGGIGWSITATAMPVSHSGIGE